MSVPPMPLDQLPLLCTQTAHTCQCSNLIHKVNATEEVYTDAQSLLSPGQAQVEQAV